MGLADFTPGLQEELIANRGVEMIHSIALKCTCDSSDIYAKVINEGKDGRRTPFCPRCGGTGWLYRSPTLVLGIATNVRYQKNLVESGFVTPGDMTFSPLPGASSGHSCGSEGGGERRIGAFDRLTATWAQPVDDGHVLVRGSGSKARAEGIITYLEDNEDRLWYEPAGSIWCEDEFGTVYTEDADFEMGPGKVIRWIGQGPRVGARYSIKYNAYFDWVAFQPPSDRVDRDGRLMGDLVYLRKRHVMQLNDSPFAPEGESESLQSRVRC